MRCSRSWHSTATAGGIPALSALSTATPPAGNSSVNSRSFAARIGLHVAVVVEMVAAEVGERRGRRRCRRADTAPGRGSMPRSTRARCRPLASSDRSRCSATGSGVVSAPGRRPADEIRPSVPRLAAGCPIAAQISRAKWATEVLPLVPVTAAIVRGWRRESAPPAATAPGAARPNQQRHLRGSLERAFLPDQDRRRALGQGIGHETAAVGLGAAEGREQPSGPPRGCPPLGRRSRPLRMRRGPSMRLSTPGRQAWRGSLRPHRLLARGDAAAGPRGWFLLRLVRGVKRPRVRLHLPRQHVH